MTRARSGSPFGCAIRSLMWTPPDRIHHKLPVAQWPTRAQAGASLLFSPVKLGPLTARQRTWVPAMVPWRATEDGRRHRRRARLVRALRRAGGPA